MTFFSLTDICVCPKKKGCRGEGGGREWERGGVRERERGRGRGRGRGGGGEGEGEGKRKREREGEREGGRERGRERESEGAGGGETGRGGEVTLLTLGCGWWGRLCNLFNLHREVHLRWEHKLDFLSLFPIVFYTYSVADTVANSRHSNAK